MRPPLRPDLACVGDSHMACVVVAAQQEGFEVDAVAVRADGAMRQQEERVAKLQTDTPAPGTIRIEGDDALSPRMRARLERGPVFVFMAGTTPFKLGFYRHPQPFDLFLPDAPELPLEEGAQIIPAAAARELCRLKAVSRIESLRAVMRHSDGPFHLFEGPAPPADVYLDARRIANKLKKSESKPLQPAQPYLRYKLWRLNCEVYRAFAAELGVEYVPSPAVALDENGFLRPEYCGNASHANVAYGHLVVDQVRARL